MFEKQLLIRDDSSRTHIYTAAISKEKSQKQALSKIIDSMFKGSPTSLVMQALGDYKPSEQEIVEIKAYLDNLQKDNR